MNEDQKCNEYMKRNLLCLANIWLICLATWFSCELFYTEKILYLLESLQFPVFL